MAKRFLTPIRAVSASADPVSASNGDIYYNTTANKLKVYANSVWIELGGGGGVAISDTAPSSPSIGDLWYNSSNSKTYIYYDSTWVEIGTASVDTNANYDGGTPTTNYGGINPLDGGGVT